MPVFIDRYDDATRTFTKYTLYKKREITQEWLLFKEAHMRNMQGNKPYVTCTVKSEKEALILIALIMRRTDVAPVCFYYDDDTKKLLASCEMTSWTIEDLRKAYIAVISMFLDDDNLEHMNKDPVGQDLFSDIAMPIKLGSPQWPRQSRENLYKHIGDIDNIGNIGAL